MLPVNLESIINRSTKHSALWIEFFTVAIQSNDADLIKNASYESVTDTIRDIERLVFDLNPNLIYLFELKVRKHPYTTEFSLFPALSTARFFEYLISENVITGHSTNVVGENDNVEVDFGTKQISHTIEADPGKPAGAYLSLTFSDDVTELWMLSDVEMYEAYDAWLRCVFGGREVFSSPREWTPFILILRALKTFDIFQPVSSHPIISVLKSRLVAFYADFFTRYNKASYNRVAESVVLSRFVSMEGSKIEAALKLLDEPNSTNNVVTLNARKAMPQEASCKQPDKTDDGDEEFSDLDFGVI
ncbi:hypothetical protein [uncultured Pseudoalteromonas sp.]|uniref:hypothetical protein n=1 Tax=uncultured Pseudoalteromonas sp. TaxID=114053 RepID=UPI0025926B31|nr:hypothetical protein [uncultured Pseudoalteromonas sp.]